MITDLKYVQGRYVTSSISSYAKLPPLIPDPNFKSGQPIYLYKTEDGSNMEFYSFDKSLSKEHKWILASMFVPKYFDKMLEELRGIFLLRIPTGAFTIQGIFSDKRIGRQGCGYKIYLSEEGMFSFNCLTYHPFILRNLTVCFFACDTGSSFDIAWRNSPDTGVAVEDAITYDHKMDLFITLNAELKPIP